MLHTDDFKKNDLSRYATLVSVIFFSFTAVSQYFFLLQRFLNFKRTHMSNNMSHPPLLDQSLTQIKGDD